MTQFLVPTSKAIELFDPLRKLPRASNGQQTDSLRQPEFKSILDDLTGDKALSKRLGNTKQYFFNPTEYPPLPSEEKFHPIDPKRDSMSQLIEGNYLSSDIEKWLVGNPLAQLLYAYIWKSTSRQKLRLIVRGVEDALSESGLRTDQGDDSDDPEINRFVFYQFGKHLVNRQEPILDKHSIRAHRFMKLLDDTEEKHLTLNYKMLEEYRGYGNPSLQTYTNYVDWIEDILPPIAEPNVARLKDRKDALDILDKIMYALGKILKKEKPKPKKKAKKKP